MLDKLEGVHPLAELIQILTQDLGVTRYELGILAGVSTETVVHWSEKHDKPAVERLDDLKDIALLLVRDGGMRPGQVVGWFRSRNPDLSLSRPLYALRRQGFLAVHRAAEVACDVLPTGGRAEIR